MALVTAVGCANFSTFQTARVIPARTYRLHGGLNYFNSSKLNSYIAELKGSGISLFFPEVGVRYGLTESLDAGARLALPGTFALDGKFQFLGGLGLASSVGFGFGYVNIATSGETRSHILEVAVPLYLSYDFSNSWGLYWAGKYLVRSQVSETSSSSRYFAFTLGTRIGNRYGVMLEGTYLTRIGTTFDALQVGAAFFFGSAPSAHHVDTGGETSVRWKGDKPGGMVDEFLEDNLGCSILKMTTDGTQLTISQRRFSPWRPGQKACVVKAKKAVACGVILRSESSGAILKISSGKVPVSPGISVVPAQGSP